MTLPVGFDANAAERALLGDRFALSLAFDWSSTTQGVTYWANISDHLIGGGSIYRFPAAWSLLLDWIEEARR